MGCTLSLENYCDLLHMQCIEVTTRVSIISINGMHALAGITVDLTEDKGLSSF